MCFKRSFSHSKRFLQTVLFFQTVFLAVQTLTPIFLLTVPNFEVFFEVIG